MNPDEAAALTAHVSRNKDLHDVRARRPDAIPADRDGSRNDAARARMEQRGHFPLIGRHWTRDRKIHTGNELLPRTARPDAVFQDRLGHAAFERLAAGDDIVLRQQRTFEPLEINASCSSHARTIPPGYDSQASFPVRWACKGAIAVARW
jgi:hypothetical protein